MKRFIQATTFVVVMFLLGSVSARAISKPTRCYISGGIEKFDDHDTAYVSEVFDADIYTNDGYVSEGISLDGSYSDEFHRYTVVIESFLKFLHEKYGIIRQGSSVYHCGSDLSLLGWGQGFRDRTISVIQTSWTYGSGVGTARSESGEGPSKAWALQDARKSAMRRYGDAIRRWSDVSCSEGTKRKSQYENAMIPNWRCGQSFVTSETAGNVARAESGTGATQEAAIQAAKKFATRYGQTLKSWGTAVCSEETKIGNQYTRTLEKYWNCSVDYVTMN
jgi:hypothetical protein